MDDLMPIYGTCVGSVILYALYYLSRRGAHSHCWTRSVHFDLDLNSPSESPPAPPSASQPLIQGEHGPSVFQDGRNHQKSLPSDSSYP